MLFALLMLMFIVECGRKQTGVYTDQLFVSSKERSCCTAFGCFGFTTLAAKVAWSKFYRAWVSRILWMEKRDLTGCCFFWQDHVKLVGGLKYFLIFTPIWVRWSNLTNNIFQMGVETTNYLMKASLLSRWQNWDKIGKMTFVGLLFRLFDLRWSKAVGSLQLNANGWNGFYSIFPMTWQGCIWGYLEDFKRNIWLRHGDKVKYIHITWYMCILYTQSLIDFCWWFGDGRSHC